MLLNRANTAVSVDFMKTLLFLSALSALLLPLVSARADEVTDKAEILRLEKEGAAAMVASDLKILGEFFSQDWKVVSPDASIMNRDQILKVLGTGLLKFVSCEQSDFDVRIYNDVAVVIGTDRTKGTWMRENFDNKSRFTDVFLRKDGKWQCVSTHSSDFPEDEGKQTAP